MLSILFLKQKYGVYDTKVWCLRYKSMVFTGVKYGVSVCNPKTICHKNTLKGK